jgi:hypothetical protein
MSHCARPECETAAKSSCSRCGREQYCGIDCQKLDRKGHKLICPILKKLSKKLQSYDEAVQVIDEILASNKGDNTRVLEHLLSYADYQFGKHVAIMSDQMVNASLIGMLTLIFCLRSAQE